MNSVRIGLARAPFFFSSMDIPSNSNIYQLHWFTSGSQWFWMLQHKFFFHHHNHHHGRRRHHLVFFSSRTSSTSRDVMKKNWTKYKFPFHFMRTIQSNDAISGDCASAAGIIFVMTTARQRRRWQLLVRPFHSFFSNWFLNHTYTLLNQIEWVDRGECLDCYSMPGPSNYIIKTNELPEKI